MVIKSIIGATCACLVVVSSNVNSTVITQGALTTNDDGSTNIITDTLNNYEWLRFDVLKDLTYAETLAVLDTQDGGGWIIAEQSDARAFVDAFLSPSSSADCFTTAQNEVPCGSTNGYINGNFGDDWMPGSDIAWYLNLESPDLREVGYVRLYENSDNLDNIYVYNIWNDIESSDRYSATGSSPQTPISWLLYRDIPPASEVPIPAAVWLFGSGLISLIGIARRKTCA